MKPISLQLYSLREESKKDFAGVIRAVAEMGYKGVEPAGLYGMEPADFRRMVEDLGMVVSSNHGPWPNRDNLDEVIETAGILGTDLVVCGFGPPDFESLDAIKRTADTANFMVEKIRAAGLTLALHNHWWEFCEVDGRLAYDVFMEKCPDMQCEIDTYWAANFGAVDPVEQVAKYKARTPLLHIKDGPLVKDKAHMAAGSGKMDLPACIAAADPNVLQWNVIELDACDTDMTTAVAESYTYLVGEGLAAGNK
jgi:sugar phosphate isomerase/epimerase